MPVLFSRVTASLALTLVAVLAATGCGPKAQSVDAVSAKAGADAGTSPLENPDGTRPGLGPVSSPADLRTARDLIAKVATGTAGSRDGYSRDQFGPAWTDNVDGVPLAHNGCSTRDDLLSRDGTQVVRDGGGCTVTAEVIYDPYTATTVQFTKQQATKIQIDHVMPLSYDWQMGASAWDKAKRTRIANDPLNLIPAGSSQNASKGDSGPAEWLPANAAVRCAYAVRWAQVSLKYALPVTAADKTAMLKQCGG